MMFLKLQSPSPRTPRRGFSFAEVMFATVILGIGFIMVAAIFPVAIQQTQSNGEENIAASVARQAAAAIASVPMTFPNPIYDPTVAVPAPPTPPPATTVQTELTFPPTVKNYVAGTNQNPLQAPSIVVPLAGARWNFSKTISILPSDPRYAYSAFYKRDNGSTSAELIVVSMAVRNRGTYAAGTDELSPQQQTSLTSVTFSTSTAISGSPPPAQPQTVVYPDTISVAAGSAAEGWSTQFPSTITAPNPVGRTYLLGSFITNSAGSDVFELLPSDALTIAAGSSGKWGDVASTPSPPAIDKVQAGQATFLNSPATIQPVVAYATLFTSSDAPLGRIRLSTLPGYAGSKAVPPAAVTGAFVIIADDFPFLDASMTPSGGTTGSYALEPNIPGNYTVGAMNGRIFRIGAPVPASPTNSSVTPFIYPGTFNLDPAYGMRPVPPGGTYSPDALPNPAMLAGLSSTDTESPALTGYGAAKVYIIGAGRTNPADTGVSPAVSGAAQDIGAFASFIQVK